MKLWRNYLFICLLALQACAFKNTSQTPSSHSPKQSSSNGVKVAPFNEDRLSHLLNFYEAYSNQTAEEQKKAFNETAQALSINVNDLTQRIKMATMLAIPTSQLRDIPKAQVQLQELMRDSNIGQLEVAYIGLLYEFTQDNYKHQQKLRDESKKVNHAQQKLDALNSKYEALQKKHDALEQKLLELKNIEKSLTDRDTKVIDKTKP